MIPINRKLKPAERANLDNAAAGAENNALNINDIMDAMVELGELFAAQDDAIVELAELIEGE